MAASSGDEFYLLELRKVPAKLWSVKSDMKEWFASCTATAGRQGFAEGSLLSLPPCSAWVQLERCVVYPLYFLSANILPVAIPVSPLLRLATPFPKANHFLGLILLEVALLRVQSLWRRLLFWAHGECKDLPRLSPAEREGLSRSQRFAEFQLDEMFASDRPNHLYFGTRWILPRSIVAAEGSLPPSVICLTPHGLIPWGQSGASNKVFGGRTSRWGAAPLLFKIWGMRGILKKFGCYPAGKKGILDCLAGGDNAMLNLDGIPGMFCAEHELYLHRRKAICAIALQAGAPLIPGFCFGTTLPCRVVDPTFGVLRRLSIKFDIALTLWFGRWWIPFGPPARRPMLMCFGDPIPCEKLLQDMHEDARRQAVDAKHAELLEAYRRVFDTHKAAYGIPKASLSFV